MRRSGGQGSTAVPVITVAEIEAGIRDSERGCALYTLNRKHYLMPDLEVVVPYEC